MPQANVLSILSELFVSRLIKHLCRISFNEFQDRIIPSEGVNENVVLLMIVIIALCVCDCVANSTRRFKAA